MPRNIIYIGNKLQRHGRTATTIDTLAPLLEAEGFNVRTASSQSNIILRFLDMLVTVAHYRNWSHYVLIDTYSTRNFWYAVSVAKLCRFLKIKYVPILHGGNLPQRLVTHKRLVTNFLDGAHAVVSPSDFLESAFAKATKTPIQVIYNSIELGAYPFKNREQLLPSLLWVRSFAAIYNPMMALDMLEILLQTQPQATLTMVGPEKDGSLEACRARAAKSNLPVTFTGLLTKAAWIKQSTSSDIFINTSNFDNLPVSLLEAMALGLPVVSTNVGGIPFLIKNGVNGFTVNRSNPMEMAAAVEHLLNHEERAQATILAARATVEQYDWQVIKLQWKTLLS